MIAFTAKYETYLSYPGRELPRTPFLESIVIRGCDLSVRPKQALTVRARLRSSDITSEAERIVDHVQSTMGALFATHPDRWRTAEGEINDCSEYADYLVMCAEDSVSP